MQVVLSAINSKYIHTGLGLRYVGEYAKAQGHEVTLIEETINTPILAVLEKIMAVPAQVYGFSVHIWNKPFVFKPKSIKAPKSTTLCTVPLTTVPTCF